MGDFLSMVKRSGRRDLAIAFAGGLFVFYLQVVFVILLAVYRYQASLVYKSFDAMDMWWFIYTKTPSALPSITAFSIACVASAANIGLLIRMIRSSRKHPSFRKSISRFIINLIIVSVFVFIYTGFRFSFAILAAPLSLALVQALFWWAESIVDAPEDKPDADNDSSEQQEA